MRNEGVCIVCFNVLFYKTLYYIIDKKLYKFHKKNIYKTQVSTGKYGD